MITVQEVYDIINGFAPFDTQLSFDNAGLLVGSGDMTVNKIGFCLDITCDIVELATSENVDLIVSHHPVIFDKLATVPNNSPVYKLIEHGICAVCAHTNYDCAEHGVNYHLINALELSSNAPIQTPESNPLLRMGTLKKPMSVQELATYVKNELKCPDVRYSTFCDGEVSTVAVCGGAGSDMLCDAKAAGAQVYITSEVKHHEWLNAKQANIPLIDAGHYFTEVIAVEPLMKMVETAINNSEVKCILLKQNSPYKVV